MRIFLILVFLLPVLSNAQKILFKNVNIVDVEKGAVIANQNVLVVSNHIKKISANPIVVNGAIMVNASGKYLIPGLWDSYTSVMDSYNESTAHRSEIFCLGRCWHPKT